jgi:arginine decarboxylase
MNIILPTRYTLVSGIGYSNSQINAFDAALINAGIGDLNLVKVSSIIPPGATRVNAIDIPGGSILHIAYGVTYIDRFIHDRARAVAMVGVVIPNNIHNPGLIMEHAYIDTTWQ